jgi:hypothetical protein
VRQLASNIVTATGNYWGGLGWLTFFGWIVVPFMSGHLWLALPLFSLWLVWWIIDLIDQQVRFWFVLLGVAMIAIGFLPRGGLLTAAAWVLYWTRLRD